MPRLHRVSILRKGYRRSQVDEAFSVLEHALASDAPPRAAQVRRVGFDLVRRGYDPGSVDRTFDRLEQRCVEAELAGAPAWQLADELAHDVGGLHEELGGAPGARFPRTSLLRKGYAPDEVDALVERCLDGLGGPLEGGQDPSADDVRLSPFRRARRGYSEALVDAAFDRIIDLLLRQAQLRHLLVGPSRAAQLPSAPSAQAAWASTDPQAPYAEQPAPFTPASSSYGAAPGTAVTGSPAGAPQSP